MILLAVLDDDCNEAPVNFEGNDVVVVEPDDVTRSSASGTRE